MSNQTLLDHTTNATKQADTRAEDLAEIIRAYNDVTDKVAESHARLESEVTRLRRELASTNAQLQRSRRLSALGEMAAGIAHEIRNPLGGIALYAQMALDDLKAESALDNVENAQTHLTHIADAVRSLDGIVNDVLQFSRDIQPRKDWLDVQALFEQAVSAHRPEIASAGVRVELDCAAPCDGMVHADIGLLHQAILNLVRNATEAMSRQEGERRLILKARTVGGDDRLTIRDTGPGIDRELVDRIFNPFFTTRHTGTGLGLAIVHRIVDAHGGSITVHNDNGAVFTCTIPRPNQAAQGLGAKAA
ncbi:sensor histidine kinase [Mucisphaera calidilacus]|uniref:histidine kinase n=1 Tax=Mucisphaera calidilacus TaxID=2527982 RepID=A0A518BYZ2_9BACT|nr:ATP-binding protein [Mucisphaera calidilacus]QDU72192.1 Globin-coupled histidine kinase [Mucisphaera calidilacus]